MQVSVASDVYRWARPAPSSSERSLAPYVTTQKLSPAAVGAIPKSTGPETHFSALRDAQLRALHSWSLPVKDKNVSVLEGMS